MLARISRHLPLEVETVNIESDDSLLQRYLIEIPVIECDGALVARAPIRERTLESALRRLAG